MDSKCIVSFLIFGFFCVRCGIFLNNVLIIKIMCGINVVLKNFFITKICVCIFLSTSYFIFFGTLTLIPGGHQVFFFFFMT